MKLKTLKDIAHTEMVDGTRCEAFIPDIQELKQEAIKWIKAIQNQEEDYGLKGEPPPSNIILFNSIEINAKPGMIYWIKHFFNINDDDLK